jgi:RNA polymerase sigma-70 factor, ECF subfamily
LGRSSRAQPIAGCGLPSSNSPTNDQRTREYLRLLGQHERRLRGYILSLVPHWADADDIAQEVRIRLWEQFDRYDPGKDFGVWARAIAHYQILTYREKLSRHRGLLNSRFIEAIAEEVAAISPELDAAEQALTDCFEKLPAVKRELLLRYYSAGQTARTIAQEQGRSFDATRQAILRTRLALSDCIDEALHKEDGP